MIYVRFFGGNGYCGCDYEEYHAYDNDDVTEAELEQIAVDMAYENAEQYEYVVTGWQEDWESEEDRESYYDDALSYCGWEYCSKGEYEDNVM